MWAATGRFPGASEESNEGVEGGSFSEEIGPAGVLGSVWEDGWPPVFQTASVPSAAGQRGRDGCPPAENGLHETGDPQDREEPQGGETVRKCYLFSVEYQEGFLLQHTSVADNDLHFIKVTVRLSKHYGLRKHHAVKTTLFAHERLPDSHESSH